MCSTRMASGNGATRTSAVHDGAVALCTGVYCQLMTRPGRTRAYSLWPRTQICLTSGSLGWQVMGPYYERFERMFE